MLTHLILVVVQPPLHGNPVAPENAPEAITKAVASLPPEQMFELMKQMKVGEALWVWFVLYALFYTTLYVAFSVL